MHQHFWHSVPFSDEVVICVYDRATDGDNLEVGPVALSEFLDAGDAVVVYVDEDLLMNNSSRMGVRIPTNGSVDSRSSLNIVRVLRTGN